MNLSRPLVLSLALVATAAVAVGGRPLVSSVLRRLHAVSATTVRVERKP